jgi:hypothetical protein
VLRCYEVARGDHGFEKTSEPSLVLPPAARQRAGRRDRIYAGIVGSIKK